MSRTERRSRGSLKDELFQMQRFISNHVQTIKDSPGEQGQTREQGQMELLSEERTVDDVHVFLLVV